MPILDHPGFPLTLALSLREREQQFCALFYFCGTLQISASGFSKRRKRILPLPKGEGRGEGERSSRTSNRRGTPRRVRHRYDLLCYRFNLSSEQAWEESEQQQAPDKN